jgi:hypothetical protein
VKDLYSIGDTVSTPDGPGTIIVLEKYRVKRYGVELSINGMQGQILFYFEKELKIL